MPDTTLTSAELDVLSPFVAEDDRQDKLHDLLETIREQIRLEIAPEHRPAGLMTNIQNAVYAMRGRTRLMDDVRVTALARAGLEAGKAEESMREALAPFAAVAEVDIGDSEADEDRFVPMSAMVARAPQITVGDMRRAAAAIRALPLTGVDKP